MASPNEMFEEIGNLYYRETGFLRPGKSDPLRDTSTEENQNRFAEWYRLKSMECAIDRIMELKEKVSGVGDRLDDEQELLRSLGWFIVQFNHIEHSAMDHASFLADCWMAIRTKDALALKKWIA